MHQPQSSRRASGASHELLIRHIAPICRPTDLNISLPRAAERILELPVRAAVLHLNSLSIRTISSSANQLDELDEGHISLAYDELAPENRAVAESLVEEGSASLSNRLGPTVLILRLPIPRGTRAAAVETRALELARRFSPQ